MGSLIDIPNSDAGKLDPREGILAVLVEAENPLATGPVLDGAPTKFFEIAGNAGLTRVFKYARMAFDRAQAGQPKLLIGQAFSVEVLQ